MSNNPEGKSPKALSTRKYAAYLGVTALLPFVLLGLLELGLRVAVPEGGVPLFEKAPFVRGDYLVASRSVGRRWFGGIRNAPSPPAEPFAREKPARAFRMFVLGESTTAGFPYPRNVTFSRLLRDVLSDVMPGSSVEVVNLGIAATNSFALLDMAGEIAGQRPDAVLIYAGHNEYYGALGTASRVRVPGGAGAVRLYLKLLRLRTVLALRDGLAAIRGEAREAPADLEAASLMEILARDRQVPLASDRYDDGVRQFEHNLAATIRTFTVSGIPVFVGSLVSNLRDQPPFAAEANAIPGGAAAVYDSARAALAVGDGAAAKPLFERARDLDVVRFRAPGEFNRVIRRVALSSGATYVPVAEAFASASRGGIPGAELLLEHVHPNRQGYALMGRAFFAALAAAPVIRERMDLTRLRPWGEYAAGMTLTPFDESIALHLVRTLGSRWPFVPVARQTDYRGSYVPSDLVDSLAFAVSRGASWERAKLQLAVEYERRQQFDSAAAEYAGLARDAPLFDEPARLLARARARAGRGPEGNGPVHPSGSQPTPESLAALGFQAVQRRQLPQAVSFFRRALALRPNQPDVLYQLSLTYGMLNDIPNARTTALVLSRMNPSYPGLKEWLATLGMNR